MIEKKEQLFGNLFCILSTNGRMNSPEGKPLAWILRKSAFIDLARFKYSNRYYKNIGATLTLTSVKGSMIKVAHINDIQ
jgi:hypothetical protein